MSIAAPSGYSLTRDFFGTVTEQGRLRMVTVNLPWIVLVDLVVPPNPERESKFNRPLTVPHAKQFGRYLEMHEDAFTPPISVFTSPDEVHLKSLGDRTLDKYGLRVAQIKRTAEIYILDGQHRIYGVMTQVKDYATKLRKLKDRRANTDPSDRELLKHFDQEIRKVTEKQQRLAQSEVTVQILLTDKEGLAKRVFSDVADNAKGISRSLLANFSDRSVFNRVARSISQSTLDGLVDDVRDRLSQKNTKWLALKDIVQVAQAMQLELGQRWTSNREVDLKSKEGIITSMTRDFFEGLIDHFDEVRQLKAGSILGYHLRAGGPKVSLLGSATIIRILAVVYGRLRRGSGGHKLRSHAEVFDAWSSALPPMAAGHEPHESGDPDEARPLLDPRWIESGAFQYPFVAPTTARIGALKHLASFIESMTREVLDEGETATLNSPSGPSDAVAESV